MDSFKQQREQNTGTWKQPAVRNPYATKRVNETIPSLSDFPELASPPKKPPPSTLLTSTVSLQEYEHGKKSIPVSEANSKPSSSSGNLEYWERMPSNNLSFGSAEILTVDECLIHASLYQQQAIRVTGLLKQRGIHSDNKTVVLELIHPIPNNDNARSPAPRSSTQHSSSSSSLLRQKRKRPWFSKTTTTTTTTTNTKSIIESAARGTLKVLVDPIMEPLSTLAIDSIVMVIGTLTEEGIQARLLQRVQQTDMTFYFNALKARRKAMQQRYKEKHEGFVELYRGCGPPPYDVVGKNDYSSS